MLHRSTVLLLAGLLASVPTAAIGQLAPPSSPGTCGNKLLEGGESCAACPADCTVQPCRPSASRDVFSVEIATPETPEVSTVVLRVGYRSDRLSLPGKAMDKAVRGRFKPRPGGSMLVTNDLDYAVRVVASGTQALSGGQLFTVEFDRCDGAPTPTAADLSCAIEACAGSTGPVAGCGCSIATVKH